jgi:hypothetical protein
MLVDFYTSSSGDVFDVAARLNGVSAPTNEIAPYLAGTSTNTSTTGSETGSGVTSTPLSGGRRTVGGLVEGGAFVATLVALGLAGAASIVL